MRLQIFFQFMDDAEPTACTGVEDSADILLPMVGDLVAHRAVDGMPFTGTVLKRMFFYDLTMGADASGVVSMTLFLDRVRVQ